MSGLIILCQFLFRLSLGLATGMALTSPARVTSGYFRNHMYVLMGLNVLSTLVAVTNPTQFALWPPLAAAVVSYVGSVIWLYEKRRAGMAALWLVAGLTLWGAWRLSAETSTADATTGITVASVLRYLDPLTGGLLLGVTMAAMFLGHWYLNSPTMQMAPLQRLVVLMTVAIALRAAVSGVGLGMTVAYTGLLDVGQCAFVALRWLSGIFGMLGLVWMTWQTLKIPNTQAATGMLYVGVIAAFLGELTSQLLSHGKPLPL